MPNHAPLAAYLEDAVNRGALAKDVARTLLVLADAGKSLAAIIAEGPVRADYANLVSGDSHGDEQKGLDIIADRHFIAALRQAPVAAVASEEQALPVAINAGAPLLVAMDPIDGSNNIETGAPLGTIFNVLPAGEDSGDAVAQFLRPGTEQLAAGYILYGAYVSLVIAYGEGAQLFVLNPASGVFIHARALSVPKWSQTYSINGSNARHWPAGIARYVRDCVLGANGPRGQDANTRWLAAMVAEAHRILLQGGIYLYPGDERPKYRSGRLRLIYEANPIGYLMEQAGGGASDGVRRILDIVPEALHQKVPLIFGSAGEVAIIAEYLQDKEVVASPLFRNRTLFSETAAVTRG